MSEASYALLGVAVGALIPALTGMYVARQARRTAAEDRQAQRDERLFDHRHIAYVDFANEVDRAFKGANAARLTLDGADVEVAAEVFEPVTNAGSAVLMFGSRATAAAASRVVGSLWDYLHDDPGTRLSLVLNEDIRLFHEAAGRDLGTRS